MSYLQSTFFALCFITQLAAQTENQPSMQDWQYPYQVHHVTISDSIDIAYIDEGKGKCTLLFLHGLGSNLKAWKKNIEVLKKDYRCIALDLPGYGKSSKSDYPFDMTFYAGAVQAFIDALHLKKVVVVGHSMGGQIAMRTVLDNKKQIKKLILIAPAGFETFTEQEKSWFQQIYTAEVVKATPEPQIIKNFHLNFYAMPDDAQFMIEDRLLMRQSVEYNQYCHMVPQCVMGMLNEPVLDRLSEIKLPTLIIFGQNDLLIPNKFLHATLTVDEVAKNGVSRMPNSKLELISEAGHFVQWEQAGKVNEKILSFLK